MDKFSLLECTLRDGGYITDWQFPEDTMKDIIRTLTCAGLDYVEVGYLNRRPYQPGTSQFQTIEQIEPLLPEDRRQALYLAMADIQQFLPENLTPCTGRSIEGIRVVFYKHQVPEAMKMCHAVKENGYKLFVQPMVTIDYSLDEYADLSREITKLDPYAVSIVDSFGYMGKSDFQSYFRILDNSLSPNTVIGFHSHNNMNLAFITAQDILEYTTTRRLVIDCSLYGMGRGAGNLQTELITNYYNRILGQKYDTTAILGLVGRCILPIRAQKEWGYSPYMFLTALYHCHPNFACYLLENHDISVSDFESYLQTIPQKMYTKCRRPYVEELYGKWQESKAIGAKDC